MSYELNSPIWGTSLETTGPSEGPVAWERMLGVWERGPSEAAARAIVPQEKVIRK